LKVVSMEELKLEVLLEPERTGETVAEVCARHGISRASFYRYRRRYREEGVAGLEPRSRRPRSSPAQIEPSLEAQIVELRRRHPRWGHVGSRPSFGGRGSSRRRWRRSTARSGATTWSPRSPHGGRRQRGAASGRWRTISGRSTAPSSSSRAGKPAWVVDCLDDHARFLLGAIARERPTGEAAWDCFVAASAAYGLPRQLLSDNHSSFTGRLLGVTVEFERRLAEAGVELINAPPAHPQTLGKLERFHRTLKQWLADERPALDLEHPQLLLDRFRVWANGVVGYQRLAINVGRRYRGATVHIVEVGKLVHVYLGEELIHLAALDRNRRYQRRGKRRRP
jgi:transposase InsO family protein